MKKRRTIIISLLLVAALALGIGYAATSGNVKVSGEVYNKPHELKLVFVSGALTATEGDSDDAFDASEVLCTNGATSATFNVKDLSHNGDFVVATFTVKNTNLYKVTLDETPSVEYTGSSFFTVTPTWTLNEGQDLTLDYEETATFTLKVQMNKTTAEELDGDFVVTVGATSAS